ncbi:response regulator transcription factor [Stenotrophomonas sp. LGBM10]|uniref:response regulator transcription factor n=1 Tax=Stenotrophomonas sp. LGBM10 TaxID=3390038 RepID=UPI00398B46B9
MHILLVEDEAELAATLRSALQRERNVVDLADTFALAREAALYGAHDLILLDRTLPDGDGLALIALLRERNPGVPVIVLSALGELPDRVEGLDEGADDYLAKPFALEELFARIRAVSRRPSNVRVDTINAGRLVFDPVSGEATVGTERLELTRREIRVLAALARRLGRTVLRESIEMAVYGFDDGIHSNTLDSHVSRLRRKLADADAGVEIHAIRGVGYLMRESR